MTDGMCELVCNFLAKMSLFSRAVNQKDPNMGALATVSERCVKLFDEALTLWPNVNIHYSSFEKYLNAVLEHPHVANQADPVMRREIINNKLPVPLLNTALELACVTLLQRTPQPGYGTAASATAAGAAGSPILVHNGIGGYNPAAVVG
eukprot:2634-Heterococcus_DN1.PRE.1